MITFARAVQTHQLLRQGSVLVTMAVLANVGLDLATIGNFESLRYIGYALSFFWINGLSNAYLRIRQQTDSPDRWTVLYLLVVLLGGVLAFALFAMALPMIGSFLLNTADLQYGMAFGIFILGQLAGSVIEQEAIADKATKRLLGFSITSYGLQVLLFLGPLLLGLPFSLAIWGLASSAVYRLGWALIRYMKTKDVRLPEKHERDLFWKSAGGLSIYGLTSLVVLMVDHFLVTYQQEEPQKVLAIWRYGAQELPLLLGVLGGMSATALSEMQDGAKEMLSNLKRRSEKVNRVFLPLVILICATSAWFFPLVLSNQFYQSHIIFNTMLLIVPCRLVQTTPLLISKDMQGLMTKTVLFEIVINIAVSLALLPSLGLLGIAIGTVVAYSFERAVYVVMLSRKQESMSSYVNTIEWLIGTLLLIAVYFLRTDFGALNL